VLEGVLYQASVELIVETPEDKAHFHAEKRAFAKIYHLDLRYSIRESPPGYPKHISLWDAGRPLTLTDLIEATDLLYGGKEGEKAPGGVPDVSEST
jgi:hypothetical protein